MTDEWLLDWALRFNESAGRPDGEAYARASVKPGGQVRLLVELIRRVVEDKDAIAEPITEDLPF